MKTNTWMKLHDMHEVDHFNIVCPLQIKFSKMKQNLLMKITLIHIAKISSIWTTRLM
jgi:hypothetical protein